MPDEDPDTGRRVQFTRHFAECEPNLQAFAYSLVPNRADAEDVIQETLAALWKHFDEYDPDRPFLPWANRFVYRQVQMHRRKQATRAKYFFSDETVEKLAAEDPASTDRDQAMTRALERCLLKLSASNRELVEHRYLSKGSLQDLAQESGHSANALYKKLQRVRELLHQCVSKGLEAEGFTV